MYYRVSLIRCRPRIVATQSEVLGVLRATLKQIVANTLLHDCRMQYRELLHEWVWYFHELKASENVRSP